MKKKLIRIYVFFYVALFILFVIGPFEKSILNIGISLLGLLFILIPTVLGKILSNKIVSYSSYYLKFNFINIFIIIAPFASLYTTFFYTGKLFESYSNFDLGVSNYREYYEYLNLNNLNKFSISKIPAIFSLTFIKYLYYYSLYLYYFIRKSALNLFAIFISIICIVHFSFARGTTLEFFDIGLYFILIYTIQSKSPKIFNYKILQSILLVFSVSIVMFLKNITWRMGSPSGSSSLLNCNTGLCYKMNLLPLYFEQIIFKLNIYFSFGLLYLTESLIFINNNYNFWIINPLYFTESISSGFLCKNGKMNCGVMWVPSALDYIMKLSFFGYIIFLFVFGVFNGFLINMFSKFRKFEFLILVYLNFVIFFSFPFSSLFSFSSSYKILYFLSIIWILFFLLRKGPKVC